MFKATLKSVLSRKLRLLLSGLAVVLGVTFVSGAFVLQDTLGRSFDAQFAGAYDDIDLQVAAKPRVDAGVGDAASAPVGLDRATVREVADVSGVGKAAGEVRVEGARALGADGKVVPSTGGPRYGRSWTGETSLLKLREGHAPVKPGEVAINAGLAEKGHFAVGDTIAVLTGEPKRTFTVAGVFGYSGDRDSIGGEQTVAFTEPVAQKLMLGGSGEYSAVTVTLDSGAGAASVQSALKKELGAGFEVRTGEELSKESADRSRDVLDLVTQVLLGFAAVAVLVGVFLIINTFSIIIAQRMRELALLRALGASRRQMIGSVLLESMLIGLVAAGVGLGLGVGLGALGASLLADTMAGLEVADLAVPASAVIVSLVVGVGVTMLAALFPALRAAKVPPIAVIRAAAAPDRRHRKQTWTGSILLVLGAGLLLTGLMGSGDAAVSAVLPGVLLAFIGVALLTPLISRPAVWLLGGMFSRSLPGQLGRRNSARNPRRTAITASALMIGVALVTTLSTVAASAKDSVNNEISGKLKAELVAMGDTGAGMSASIDPAALRAVRGIDGVDAAAGASFDTAKVGGATQTVSSWEDWKAARGLLSLRAETGSIGELAPGSVLMNKNTAKDRGVKVGDKVTVQLQRGERRSYRLAGTFAEMALANSVVVPWADATKGFRYAQPSQAYIKLAPGASADSVQPRVEKALRDSPEVTVQSKEQVAQKFNDGFDMMLNVVQALLAVAMIIAVLGIVNTLALSVMERTKELGALRAIGLGRGQTIRMIMTESVVISLFGAVLGVLVGSGLGLAVARSMKSQGVSSLSLPWALMAVYLAGAALIGMLASLGPARRGARLNVLRAVTQE
ncbi:ABC transporter permease [Streptomyces sp. NEAU-Y11]|uniref:ABC transporter permease n=1 Tax=Streptomyces cucumeris TaxID=2962890 RepID=UPI0020C8CD34|nr:ABC transporter permease [Streptomyces sp. NEAU-Y11]MCP9206910.1 ABC transporter permease [Streptomyces sp. NEAU-Y11]